MSNDKNGTKYGNMGIKWTVLIRLIDIRTQNPFWHITIDKKSENIMNVIFPMYFGEKRGCSSAGSSSSSRKLKKCFSCYTYALEWGQQQCPCKFQLLVFLNTPNVHLYTVIVYICTVMNYILRAIETVLYYCKVSNYDIQHYCNSFLYTITLNLFGE